MNKFLEKCDSTKLTQENFKKSEKNSLMKNKEHFILFSTPSKRIMKSLVGFTSAFHQNI